MTYDSRSFPRSSAEASSSSTTSGSSGATPVQVSVRGRARVFEAASVGEALEVLSTARPPMNLVITDVVMPEVNGVDLSHVIREQWPATRVLFMSAFPAEVLVREGLDNPDVMFLAEAVHAGRADGRRSSAALRGRRRADGEKSKPAPPYLVTLTTRHREPSVIPRASSRAASKRLPERAKARLGARDRLREAARCPAVSTGSPPAPR